MKTSTNRSRRRPPTLALLLLSLLVSGGAGLAQVPPPVAVTDNGEVRQELPGNRVQSVHDIALRSGDFVCNLSFRNSEYRDAEGRPERVEGTVGVHLWPEQGQGWYPNGTFTVFADGTSLTSGGVLRGTRVLEQGAAALVETTLEHPRASVRLRFAYRPGQEGLDVQVLLLPPAEGAAPISRLSLELACYPGYYTAWNKRRGHRWVVTPLRAIEEIREEGLDMKSPTWTHQVREEPLNPAQEPWLFYYDEVFNSADGNGRGMCGLVLSPAVLAQAQVNVSDYEIVTKLTGQAEQRALTFTLWQSPERDYPPQLARFPAVVEAARARLQDGTLFLPQSLVGFDLPTEARTLEPLVETPDYDRLVTQAKALAAAVAELRATPASLAGEQAALERLSAYRRDIWKAERALPRPRRLLVLQGAHYPSWRLAEAVAVSEGSLQVDESFFSASWRGDRLTTFPATESEMLQYDAVVFNNVSAVPLRESGEALLKQFVLNGGGLVVLSGFYAYGQGAYQGSVLEELLPVTFAGPFDVKRLAAPARLQPGTNVPGLPALPRPDPGVVLWLQDLQPKPGATVAVQADLGGGRRAPFLVVGRAGEGRVAACAGTVYGVAPGGMVEFWNHREWPAFLAGVLRWCCGQTAKPGT